MFRRQAGVEYDVSYASSVELAAFALGGDVHSWTCASCVICTWEHAGMRSIRLYGDRGTMSREVSIVPLSMTVNDACFRCGSSDLALYGTTLPAAARSSPSNEGLCAWCVLFMTESMWRSMGRVPPGCMTTPIHCQLCSRLVQVQHRFCSEWWVSSCGEKLSGCSSHYCHWCTMSARDNDVEIRPAAMAAGCLTTLYELLERDCDG